MPMSIDHVRALSTNGTPIKEGLDYYLRTKGNESYIRIDYTALIQQLSLLNRVESAAWLKKSSELNWHALMTVSRYYPDCLPGLFDALYKISPQDRNEILEQRNLRGKTALDLTIGFYPKRINHWIDAAIKHHDLSLFTSNPKVFKCIAKQYPAAFKLLLPMLTKLDYKTQRDLFNGKSPLDFARQYVKSLNQDHQARAAFAHAQTHFFLQKMKLKIYDLNSRVGFLENLPVQQAKETLKTLYTTLQESYDTYLALQQHTHPLPSAPPIDGKVPPYSPAPPPPMTLDRLKEIWTSAIRAAAPVLSQHRGHKEELFKTGMLGLSLISLGAPIWYSLHNHHSFFPPSPETDTMHIVKEVADAFKKELQFKTLEGNVLVP